MEDRIHDLRKAITNLINIKLHDAIAHPNGLERLIAHRSTGVASFAVRQAETQLQTAIAGLIDSPGPHEHRLSMA